MQLKNSESRYGAVAQLLHWAIAALIIVQVVLSIRAEEQKALAKLGTLSLHKSFGMTILGLVILRFL